MTGASICPQYSMRPPNISRQPLQLIKAWRPSKNLYEMLPHTR
ncbi:hypothetical protein TELCIR_18359 [Teladorsagia circumcincta]|uniref:Uncharacterized protein n=1 Tax=Teladorsagia circumcincta TaxID=45464 RepID=A0A2G9TRQ7_TELCI|nr:hypothetical protein TELCIR_18359 [Teladorsagia circumcincta]